MTHPFATRLKSRLVEPLLAVLRQGTAPDRLALSLAFGLGLGIFPVLGISTLLCTVVALALRLNLPAIQLVNYAVAPLQLLLIIPFVRLGEHLSGAVPEPLSIRAGLALLANGVAHAVEVLWGAILHAALGWAVLGPPGIALLYLLFRPLLERAAARLQSRGTASATDAGP